ncbi:MAG: hypothetical protein K9N51_11895 [Candidatus Pacebacteria bacterium]|nr:hypothetical protein [Candidatus Paceibacterota bacterium]
MSNTDPVAIIKRTAADIGYLACGITTAAPFTRFADALRDRVARFPKASSLYAHMSYRADPRRTTPWARSIVVCIRRYGKYDLPPGLDNHIGRNYLADQRVPQCPDHDMPKRMTAALKKLGLKVKRGGTPDRLAAARAGVVRIGRNGFAYHEKAGSWLNISTWRVDAELPADQPDFACPCPDDCRACMDHCPTGAIVDPYVMRMDRCIAYLTYHAPHPIAPDLWAEMGPWIYGCDACQRICPLNDGKWQPEEPATWLDEAREYLTPQALADMGEVTYREVVHPLFWYIPLDDLERWHKNARRADEQEYAIP